jgi:hypothetical protein
MGDVIAFQNHLQATIEHGTNNTFDHADESGVRYYYLAATVPAADVPEVPLGPVTLLIGAGVVAMGVTRVRRSARHTETRGPSIS